MNRLLFFLFTPLIAQNYITNERGAQVGDAIVSYCFAKILSVKHPELKFTYTPFIHSEAFVFDNQERIDINHQFAEHIRVFDENSIKGNIHKDNVLFITNIETKIDHLDQSHINILKQEVKLKIMPQVNSLPENITTVAVHIRKGNGGGQFYDGEQASHQIYDHDKCEISYLTDYFNYPFDYETYTRGSGKLKINNINNYQDNWSFVGKPVDKVDKWQTKFPPEQYYIDQIIRISQELKNQNLYVQIFTDDKDAQALTERIKNGVNLQNITFYYHHNRDLSFKEQISQDLYSMSRFDILIRSQSYFSRIAELMGNHKQVIYPLEFKWEDNKLIMHKIVVKKRKLNIGLLVTATGKYIQFAQQFIESAKRYFLNNHNLKIFLFTDEFPARPELVEGCEQVLNHTKTHWPFDATSRWGLYFDNKDKFETLDYIFACDVDLKFLNTIDDSIIGERVALKHPFFDNVRGRYETTNTKSKAYIAPHEGEHYYYCAFVGGSKPEFLNMCKTISDNLNIDAQDNGFMAEVHDESHWNRYFVDNKPMIILDSKFGSPQEWGYNEQTKILYLAKDHDEIRK